MIEKYECDQCGACCKGPLLVEVYELDVMREPSLLKANINKTSLSKTANEVMEMLRDDSRCLLIAAGDQACRFLGDENKCEIYPTRPNVCVDMQAGDECCQIAREYHGLEPLMPRNE